MDSAVASPISRNGLWRTYGLADGLDLLDLTLEHIAEDQDGCLWFGTAVRGALRFDGGSFHRFDAQDGLPGRQVRAILLDRGGRLWFGTWDGGVGWRDEQGFHPAPAEKASPSVTYLFEDRQGRIWAAGREWIGWWNGERFRSLASDTGLGCWGIAQDREGDLWFACLGPARLLRWDGAHLRDGAPAEPAGAGACAGYAVAADSERRIWAARGERVWRWSGGEFEPVPVPPFRGYVRKVQCDRQGRVWLCTSDGVLWYDGDGFSRFTPADGLAGSHGNLWIATWGGLSCFDGDTFRSHTTQNGLPSDHVLCLYEDRQGQLWLGTGRGPVRYSGHHFQALSSPHIGPTRAILQDGHGAYWFGTHDGLVRYVPGGVPPSVRLVQVVGDRVYGPDEQVEIPSSTRQITLEYRGTSFRSRATEMLYTWRLQGWQEEWQPPAPSLRAQYQDLPPGNYVFEVCAIDRDLHRSAPASLAVRVVPDPWRQSMAEALNRTGPAERFVGCSAAMRRVEAQLAQVAPSDLAVLILGETGTGKGVAARAIHRQSRRAGGPFVQVTCGAIPQGLVESELLGHERGAFTGASSRRLGRVELAQGGTLFLDEIGDLPAEAQAKLLRVLDEKTFERVGGARSLQADVRIVAATNRDLKRMVADGDFRQDLYYRLRIFEVVLPPLRQRREDIPLLADYFRERMADHLDKPVGGIAPAAVAALQAYAWPGNVRELEHVVQRAVVVCRGTEIELPDLSLELERAAGHPAPLPSLDEVERQHIQTALELTGGVVKGPQGAAALLGVPASTLGDRIRRLGLQPSRVRPSRGLGRSR
ncbi:MAG: sigma 54-interacting transcriptional regulator [Candidatus Latescibacterota bacterium]